MGICAVKNNGSSHPKTEDKIIDPFEIILDSLPSSLTQKKIKDFQRRVVILQSQEQDKKNNESSIGSQDQVEFNKSFSFID